MCNLSPIDPSILINNRLSRAALNYNPALNATARLAK
jgi:hypothetical protein